MRLLLFWLIFVATAATAQESPHDQGSRFRELVSQYANGDTATLPAIRELLNGSRSRQELAHALCDTLLCLAEKWSVNGLYRKAVVAEYLGLRHATLMADKALISDHLVGLAFNYCQMDILDSTRFYLNQLLQIPVSEWSDYATISCSNVQALMAEKEGKYLEAIEHYWKVLEMGTVPVVQMGTIQSNLAVLFTRLGHHQRSIHYSNQALAIYEQQNDSFRLSDIHSNLGVSWMHLDSLERAAFHHLASIRYSAPNTFACARGLANYANVLRRQGRLQVALAIIDSSIHICQRLDIPFGVALNRVNRAHVLLNMQKPAEALGQLRESEQYPPVFNAFKTEICSLYYAAYKAVGNKSEAFDFLQKYMILKDSAEQTGSERIVLEWEERIIRSGKDRELIQLNRELEATRQHQRMILVFSGMLLLLAAAGGGIFFLRRQRENLAARLIEEENGNMLLQLEIKERELTTQSIHLHALGKFTEEIGSKLIGLRAQLNGEKEELLGKIIREFEQGVSEEIWEDFRSRFERVNDDFNHKLLQLCPDLTPVELKIASYLRLNLSSKEISQLTNRSAGTISNTRSALRKKLRLEEEDNLVAYLMAL
jgi:tetratricopeptide (TPR) repeat protein